MAGEESLDDSVVLMLGLIKKLFGRNKRAVVENVVDEHGEPKRRIKRADLEREPYLAWNSFVDLIIMTEYEDLSPRQRGAHLALWYQSEVMNGGHLQYFENRGTIHLEETIEALRALGAEAQAAILSQARERYFAKERPRIDSVWEYVKEARKLEYEDLDNAFYNAKPSLDALLEKHLHENIQWYLEIID